MENKIAVITIIVNYISAVDTVNSLLHEYRDYVIGRMGIPYKPKEVNIISVVLDASQEKINGLSGKLGMINGVTSKVLTAK